MEEHFPEGDERECVRRIGKQVKVGDELILCGYLQVISGLGLAVVQASSFIRMNVASGSVLE